MATPPIGPPLPFTPPTPSPREKSIDLITPGATLDAQNFLVVPGLGHYRLKLLRGGVDVTQQLLKNNPHLMQKMADAAWEAFRAGGIIDDRGNAKANSLGDHVEIYQKGNNLVLNPGKPEVPTPHDITNQTANDKYRELTIFIQNILQDQHGQSYKSSQQNAGQQPSSQKTPGSDTYQQGSTPGSKIRVETDTDEDQAQGAKKAGTTQVTIALDKDKEHSKSDAIEDLKKNKLWKHKTVLGILKGNTDEHGGIKPELRTAINTWFVKPRINYFGIGQRYKECPISELLQEPGNEALREILISISKNQVPQNAMQNSLDQTIQAIPLGKPNGLGEYDSLKGLLDLIVRNPRVVTMETPDGSEIGKQIQTFAKGVDSLLKQKLRPAVGNGSVVDFSNDDLTKLFVRDSAWTSESAEQQGHCSNLGVVNHLQGGVPYITCLRSGRTTDEDSLRESVFFGFIANLTTTGVPQPGRRPNGGISWNPTTNEYEYQQVIETLKDYSKGKSIGSQLAERVLGQKPMDDEKSRIDALIASIDNWPANGLKISFDYGTPARKIIINLKKPILTHEVFSLTLSSKRALPAARKESAQINWVGNQQLLALFVKECGVAVPLKTFVLPNNSGVVRVDYSTGNVTFTGPNGLTTPASFRTIPPAFWTLPAKQQADLEMANLLQGIINTPAQQVHKPAAIALYALFTGKYPEFNETTNVDARLVGHDVHAAHLVMYRKIIFNYLRMSHSVQCFNGVDSTGIAVALEAAQDQFYGLKNKFFEPHTDIKEDISLFSELYNRSIAEFAESVTVQERAQWGLSAEGERANPAAILYMDPENTFNLANPYQISLEKGEHEASFLGESLASQRALRNQAMAFEYVQEHVQPIINTVDKLLGIKLNEGLNLIDSWKTLRNKINDLGALIDKVGNSTLKELSENHPELFDRVDVIYGKENQVRALESIIELRGSIESRQPFSRADQDQLTALNDILSLFGELSYRGGEMVFTELATPQQIKAMHAAVNAASGIVGKKPAEIIGADANAELVRIHKSISDKFELFQDTLLQLRYLYERCDYLQKQKSGEPANPVVTG